MIKGSPHKSIKFNFSRLISSKKEKGDDNESIFGVEKEFELDQLEELLNAQEVISRGQDNSGYFEQKKERLLEVFSSDETSKKKLEKLCELKRKIVGLEMDLEDTEKIVEFISVEINQSIVGVEGDVEIGGNFSPKMTSEKNDTHMAKNVAQQQHIDLPRHQN